MGARTRPLGRDPHVTRKEWRAARNRVGTRRAKVTMEHRPFLVAKRRTKPT